MCSAQANFRWESLDDTSEDVIKSNITLVWSRLPYLDDSKSTQQNVCIILLQDDAILLKLFLYITFFPHPPVQYFL